MATLLVKHVNISADYCTGTSWTKQWSLFPLSIAWK